MATVIEVNSLKTFKIKNLSVNKTENDNFKNIHISGGSKTTANTQDETVFGNVRLLEAVTFCHKSSILNVRGAVDPSVHLI